MLNWPYGCNKLPWSSLNRQSQVFKLTLHPIWIIIILFTGPLLSSRNGADEQHHLLVCPCGECTIDSYFANGCPKMPKCISPSADRTFPHLDTSNLTKEEKHDLEERLKEETKSMMCKYGRLVTSTNESLQKQEVNPEDLAISILSIGLFQTYENKKPVLSNAGVKIRNACSIQCIFLELMCFWSFFNYELLEYIIEYKGTTEDKANLRVYLDDLEKYCQRRIFEVPSHVYGNESNKENWAKFTVKLDDEIKRLQDLRHVRRKIAKILGLQSPTLYLCDITEGCVEVLFMIPQMVAQKVFPLSDGQQSSLSTNHVVMNSFKLVNPQHYSTALNSKQENPESPQPMQLESSRESTAPLKQAPVLPLEVKAGKSRITTTHAIGKQQRVHCTSAPHHPQQGGAGYGCDIQPRGTNYCLISMLVYNHGTSQATVHVLNKYFFQQEFFVSAGMTTLARCSICYCTFFLSFKVKTRTFPDGSKAIITSLPCKE